MGWVRRSASRDVGKAFKVLAIEEVGNIEVAINLV